jgi:signal transduction histidine kinase
LKRENPKTVTLARWPVLIALGLVTLLIIGMIGLDIFFSQQEARRTTDIVENSQRSIILLNDIRNGAKRLSGTNIEHEISQLTYAIAAAAREYDPIATFPGERVEWNHLQDLLRGLSGKQQQVASGLEQEIDNSVDKLVSINLLEGNSNVAAIRAAHRQAVWSDAVVGAIVLATVTLISLWLMSVLSRQRQLIIERVQFLDEKNNELEAFAGRAALDLRSPMNPIRGYTDLILETPGLYRHRQTIQRPLACETVVECANGKTLSLAISGIGVGSRSLIPLRLRCRCRTPLAA